MGLLDDVRHVLQDRHYVQTSDVLMTLYSIGLDKRASRHDRAQRREALKTLKHIVERIRHHETVLRDVGGGRP